MHLLIIIKKKCKNLFQGRSNKSNRTNKNSTNTLDFIEGLQFFLSLGIFTSGKVVGFLRAHFWVHGCSVWPQGH